MDNSNGDKSRHGVNAQNSLEDIFSFCKEHNYIDGFMKNYRAGLAGYRNDVQFYAPFLLMFPGGERWIIFSTTSMRTDRIKGQQWDAHNLKQINSSITAAYLVYPNGLPVKDMSEFCRQNAKYVQGFEFSAIDGILSQDQLYRTIEEHALQDLNIGQIKDLQGRYFEERVASTLSNSENLTKWLKNDRNLTGMYYSMFETILNSFDLQNVPVEIRATTSKEVIKKLPSGGNPKTDIFVEVIYEEDCRETFTISCKRTNRTSVSVHQYTADTFANVLDPSNESLRYYLNQFQAAGSVSGMGEDAAAQLTEALEPYLHKLALWVLGGNFGDGNPSIQWASHILTYDDEAEEMSIHKVEDYYDILLAEGARGNFGTCFSWTYPSKRRGQSIQLKCSII